MSDDWNTMNTHNMLLSMVLRLIIKHKFVTPFKLSDKEDWFYMSRTKLYINMNYYTVYKRGITHTTHTHT